MTAAPLALAFAIAAAPLEPAEHTPLFMPGIHYGSPLGIAGGLTVFVPVKEEPGFRAHGFVVEGSAGRHGIRGSFGVARVVEYFGLEGRAVVQHTDSTCAGAEAGMWIQYFRASVGYCGGLSWNVGLQVPLHR